MDPRLLFLPQQWPPWEIDPDIFSRMVAPYLLIYWSSRRALLFSGPSYDTPGRGFRDPAILGHSRGDRLWPSLSPKVCHSQSISLFSCVLGGGVNIQIQMQIHI